MRGQARVSVSLGRYLTPDAAETAEARANAWIKSLRHAVVDGDPLRDRFAHRGDSLWWFTELYFHKQRTINHVHAVILAADALIARERPDAIDIEAGGRIARAILPGVARRHGIPCRGGAEPTADLARRLASDVAARVYAVSPRVKHLRRRRSRGATAPASSTGADIVVFVHFAFWRADTGDDTYVGPIVESLQARFGSRVRIVSLGPSTNFKRRTWQRRLQEWWRDAGTGHGEAAAFPTPIEAFVSAGALDAAHAMWRERREVERVLLASTDLREASRIGGVDAWPVLAEDFSGIASLQLPWSVRAMDEAADVLDALRPAAIVTYAEAGGWGRALVLEARRRGIVSIGLQHGFISRHWLNYQHETDEVQPAAGHPADRGYPFPTSTLLYDDLARAHLMERGRFPADALQVVGNPRMDALAAAAEAIASADVDAARRATGARADQHLVLLAAKRIPEFDETLSALMDAVRAMPDVHLAVRPHPAETPEPYARLAAGAANIRIVPLSLSPVALIKASRLVVTINSTVAIEATILGVPALAMRLPNYLSPFVDAGAMAGTAALQDVAPTVRRLVHDASARDDLMNRARAFVDRYAMAPDGRAAERTVAAIAALIERP